jgi:hypothetical protein
MEGKGATGKGPSYSDHSGLELRRGPAHGHGGRIAQCALTSARLAQATDGGGRGVPGGAVDGVWVAATRQRARTMAAELAAAMAPRCFASVNTARTRGEWREGADRRMPWRP